MATDIDPLAVDAARQTVRQNRLAQRVQVQEGSIPADDRFDLVVANLTADLLQFLAADLASAVIPDGSLIVSGLLATRRDEVATALSNDSLQLRSVRTEDDWCALLLNSAL